MKQNILLATTALLLTIPVTGTAVAQTAKDLLGTWTSVSNVSIQAD